jgi:serine/threonine protein kinase
MAPKRFGKYEVLARIATGGAANIFLARQPGAADFHKLVCLKTLLPERASDEDFVAMFLDEARLAARLNHPNCVQIFDLGRVRGSFYISMEYIFGETLWNLLATVTKLRTPLPAPHVASILSSVCDGLHHAHELKDSNGRMYNLVHRDVSPQNVMITFEGQTKVVDFGIAKAETGRVPTMAGIVKGKFSYMSPEQITGGTIDRRSDVYSLGIVLFECLASRRLYRGDTPEEIARLILEHRAPRLRDVVPDIPPALDNICAIALARHPSKRFQTAHAMGEALRDFLDSIRYAQSSGAIARLVEQRFEGQISERRKVFEAALAGNYDEAHLLKVLDARAVRDLDLFPEGEEQKEDGEDFVELDEGNATTQFEPEEQVPSEVDETANIGRVESTQVDVDGEEHLELAARRVPPDGTTTLEPSKVASVPLNFGETTQLEGEAGDSELKNIKRIGLPLDGDTGPVDTPPPSRAPKKPGFAVTTRSRGASVGGSAAALELSEQAMDNINEPSTVQTNIVEELEETTARPPPMMDPTSVSDRVPMLSGPVLIRPQTNDMIPPPLDPHEVLVSTKVTGQSYDGIAVKERSSANNAWLDASSSPDTKPLPSLIDAADRTPPPNLRTPRPSPSPVPLVGPASQSPLSSAVTPKFPLPGAEARFGSVALFAALALGIAIGLVLGLMLARLIYAPVPIPVTPTRTESAPQ